MRVLWFTNLPTPDIANCCNLTVNYGGGWLVLLSKLLSEKEEIELDIAFPQCQSNETLCGKCDLIRYWGFYSGFEITLKESEYLKKEIHTIIENVSPDIINIIGTEYIHSYIALSEAESFGLLGRSILTIQGFASECWKHYNDFVPLSVVFFPSIGDLKKKTSLFLQARAMMKRGSIEKKTIKKAKNICGRTLWDKRRIERINPYANYYSVNETLREEFYHKKWNYEKCKKHSIFISQAQYPLKGFHIVVKAVSLLKEEYPDILIKVAGNNITDEDISNMSSYAKYLSELIFDLDVADNICFLGNLSSKEVVEELLISNVFISASSIENSSNSICEAMIVGTPTIATEVGGTNSLIRNETDGLLCKAGNARDMAEHVRMLFNNPMLCLKLSDNSREVAIQRHNIKYIERELINLYHSIIGKRE